ncbi:S9 family peptidase [Neobacillus ginsengisoli]|uniref:Dipeptidyl aminopeptidase/acylaminoacyl peptidase n=1 Tax=Neobacillus ginsengisoli TaxID=904295 RepID=A0ABT9XVE8_9BACI|nr:S9 family peptidase [Neobacillus ginsengisoli]MDQ0199533.1 dipeptidyl aminopeptidase/acylaminoacyl peptidase [Neobacillus ginsengisoli]
MENFGIKPFLDVRSARKPVYQPDGHKLSFIADYSGLPQVWELNLGGGRSVLQASFTNESIKVVKYIKHTSTRIISMDVAGNEKQQLFLLKRDHDIIRLTDSPNHIHHYGGSSPNGKWIAWSSNRRNLAFFDIYIQNLETLEIRRLFSDDGMYSSIKWSPDGQSLLIRKTNTHQDNDLGILQINTGDVDWVTPHIGEASFKDPYYNKDGDHLYLLTNKDREHFGLAMINLYSKDLTWLERRDWDFEELTMNKEKNMLAYSMNEGGISSGVIVDLKNSNLYSWKTPMGVISDLTFSPNNQKLAYVFNGPENPSDIWELDIKTIHTERLTYSSRSPGGKNKLVKPELITYKSFDNLHVPAFFYKPVNTSKKHPVVVYIHGGPESQIRAVYNPILQYLLSIGFAVCTPNVRGSTGYGKTYTHLDDVRKRMDSVKDLVSLVEWLKAEGSVDQRKIALMGGSYGGFMVLAAISHYPHLWSAAIDIVGISSFRTFLKNTNPWRQKLREFEYGTIEKDGEFFDQIDPLNHTDKIISPLMVFHGANDPRVPIEESEQIVYKLKERNHPVKYFRFEDEGHSFEKRKNKIFTYTKVADFLEEYIGKKF